MFNRKETCVVTTVLFLGVILSCAIFFGVSYILDASILDESIDHQSFDRSFYENEDVNRIVTFLDYRLFGTLKTKNVIGSQKRKECYCRSSQAWYPGYRYR